MKMMFGDTLPRLRQDRTGLSMGVAPLPNSMSYARWQEALRTTVLLWSFVLLVFLPLIIRRHAGESVGSVVLDCSTILMSMAIGMGMFFAWRQTLQIPPLLKLPLRMALVVLAAAVNTAFDLIFQGWVANNLVTAWQTLPDDFTRAYSSTMNYIFVFGVNMILFHVNFSRSAAIQQERQLAEAEVAAQQAQITALRYQLNPHFLFNSLNSISALIVTGRNGDAEAMTQKLSSFLRTSLGADPTGLIPLEEELGVTEEYLAIESVRFGDRLGVRVECQGHAGEALVPSFLVQPLVENAVKHGVARSRVPVTIEIDAEITDGTLCITVSNDLIESTGIILRGTEGSGVGLENVRRRLNAVFGPRASLTAGPDGDRFIATICVPEIKLAN